MDSIDLLKKIALGFIFAFTLGALANSDDICPYAGHAYGSYSAVDRSNICADSTVSQTLPACSITSSSSPKKASKGIK